jgi:hypothetical protein
VQCEVSTGQIVCYMLLMLDVDVYVVGHVRITCTIAVQRAAHPSRRGPPRSAWPRALDRRSAESGMVGVGKAPKE